MSERTVNRRRGRLLRITAASAVLLAIGGYLVLHWQTSGGEPPQCTVRAADGGSGRTVTVEPQQAANAATIEAVASARRLPERAVVIALATAMQESALRNIGHGDRDSVGLFQQRPSQGWGTAEQIMDPVYSAEQFYDRLVKIPGYTQLPLTDAAQQVQRSAFPQAYAKHEPDATLLAAALTGREPASLTCTAKSDSGERLQGDPAAVRRTLTQEFGADALPDAAKTSGAGGRGTASRVVTVPVNAPGRGSGTQERLPLGRDRSGDRPRGGDDSRDTGPPPGDARDREAVRRGWEVAHWAMAHAADLGIERIAYQDRVWTADRSSEGWRTTRDEEHVSEVQLTTAQ